MDNSTESEMDTLIGHASINITEADKRMNSTLSLKEYYTVYIIETKINSETWAESKGMQKLSLATRRYTDFVTLHNHLGDKYPWIVIPPLPEKKQSFMWNSEAVSDTMDPDFVDRRRAGLESFLKRIAGHYELGYDECFLKFLGEYDNWMDSAKPFNSLLKDTELTIKTMNASMRGKNSDKRFEAIQTYSNKLQGSLNKILTYRTKQAERLYNVDMLHLHYGRIFSELSAIDNDIGDGVQRTGHYMDTIASAISPALEDEEIIMDQLKEYLAFTNSLQTFVKNHDLLHYNLNQLNSMSNNKETSGIMSRLFGYTAAAADRDTAAKETFENKKTEAKANYEEFVDKSLENYKEFERQKDLDLTKILKDYVAFQTKYAQKMMNTIIGGKSFESTNNSKSIAEKLGMLPSTAQSRGLPSMAPVYRTPINRKRLHYLSYYPKERKHTRSFPWNIEKSTNRFSSNVERPQSVVQNIRFPETQKPMEKSLMKRSLPLNNDLQPKTLKTCPAVGQKKQEIIEPVSTYGVTYVYDKWPESKGDCLENFGFL